MNPTFTKHYASHEKAARAATNHAWLAGLGLSTPRLIAQQAATLIFEHVHGRHVAPHDVLAAAALLGELHATAYQHALHTARLDTSYAFPGAGTSPAFTSSRTARITAILQAGTAPAPVVTLNQALHIIHTAGAEPAALYKDSNPRNFLITTTGITVIDFDDLTTAPFGYDLAKLLVTTAMTHGPLPASLTTAALDAYNTAVPHPCTPDRLADWAEIHHILTSPYLGRHGYTHSRPTPLGRFA